MSIAAIVAGCHLMPAARPAIECIDLPAAECERQAAAIIADARRDTPNKRIVRITLSAHDGGQVNYDDGSAMFWTH